MKARTIPLWVAVAVTLAALATVPILKLRQGSITLTGVVLRQDEDPHKQLPIPDATITAFVDDHSLAGKSDTSGLFHLKLPKTGWRNQDVTLRLQDAGYEPLEITSQLNNQNKGELYVLRMTPSPTQSVKPAGTPPVVIKDVRVRYAEKTSNVVSVGSAAQTFTVPNSGGVPCANNNPCSPDGKWKAAVGGITMDAGEGQQFENVRVSCIAGPCPFTKIETGENPHPGRKITVRVKDWSDTVTFLVEAEVTRVMPNDAIRQAYPAIYGRSMSFTLPASAQGPSIQLDLNGSDIVFPLGPALRLSWATCGLQVAPDKTKLYVCDLKPGYEFK
jgi:hypothetical protein